MAFVLACLEWLLVAMCVLFVLYMGVQRWFAQKHAATCPYCRRVVRGRIVDHKHQHDGVGYFILAQYACSCNGHRWVGKVFLPHA